MVIDRNYWDDYFRDDYFNFDFFDSKLSHEIDPKNIKLLSSDENESMSEFSNFIQLSDVLLGIVRSSFSKLGSNQKGQRECVEKFIDVIERFNDKKKD